MKPDNSNLADRESRLEEAVLSYYEALDEGRVPDCEELLALHPDLAAELKEFFADTVTVSPLLRDSATEASRSEPIPDCLGSYRLVEMIGQGAQAEVYRALHLTINKTVALKLIRGGQLASPSELQRFRNDAAILAELDHPNIVPAYDIQEEGGQIYFIMKFIEGGNLENQLGQFPAQPRAGAKLMIAIARAVHHAHQGGILHRDLKPRNILLDRDGQPYVTDFGLAKRLLTEAGPDAVEESATRKKPIGSASTLDGGILGTALWMAPEAASGKKKNITTASDVYGLGAIFYALLTGQPPFIGETLLDILAKVKEVKPVPPRTRNHRVDRDLDAICLKCLEKEAKKRYGSAEALALDLERYLEGKPVHARPIGTVPRTWKWMKRRPALAGLLAVSAAAILTMLVGGVVFTQKLSVALSDSLAKEKVARHHLFNLQLHRVADIWKRDPHLARLLLEDRDSCPPELQDFTWNYFYRLCKRPMDRLDQPFTTMAVDPSGNLLAMVPGKRGDQPPPLQVIVSYLSGDERRQAFTVSKPGDSDMKGVTAVAFSPDAKYLVAGCANGTACLWEIASRKLVRTFQGHDGAVTVLAFDPKGKTLAAAGQGKSVTLWDVESGKKRILEGHNGEVTALAFAPDGKTLASGSVDRGVCLWNLDSGKVRGKPLMGHTSDVTCVAFSPDGRKLASGSADFSVCLWDLHSNKTPDNQKMHTHFVTGVTFAANGQFLVSGSLDGKVQIWAVDQAGTRLRPFRSLPGHTAGVTCVAATAGNILVTGANSEPRARAFSGNEAGEVKLWDLNLLQENVAYHQHTFRVTALMTSRDGNMAASVSTDSIRLWDLTTGDVLQVFPGHERGVTSLALSADDKFLVSGSRDNTLKVWEVRTGKLLRTCKGHGAVITAVAFHGNTLLASASEDATVKLWDPATGKELATLKGHAGPVTALAFRSDGQILASASKDGTVKLWDLSTYKESDQSALAHGGEVTCLAFNHNGRFLASGGKDQRVKVWDLAKQESKTLKHEFSITAVAFTTDDKTLAAAAENHIKLWDVFTAQERSTLIQEGVTSLAFAGDSLVSGGVDGKVRVWKGESVD